MRTPVTMFLMVMLFLPALALAQDGAGAAHGTKMSALWDVLKSDVIVWVILGAITGWIMNARHPHYEGMKPFFDRYGLPNSKVTLLTADMIFFVGLGPVIITAAYDPVGVFQGLTLGIGWPLVIRGILTNMEAPSGSRPGGTQ